MTLVKMKLPIGLEELRRLYEVERLSCAQIAAKCKCAPITIGRRLRDFGIQMRKTGPLPGQEHPDWKGGVTIRKGYVMRYAPSHPANQHGYVQEHRLIMERILGRRLREGEVVHHEDGNKSNNHPDNLVLFESNGKHLKHELTGKCPNWTKEGKAAMEAAWKRLEVLPPSKDELMRMYVQERMTQRAIASNHGCSQATIRKALAKHKIPSRSRSESHTIVQWPSPEALEQMTQTMSVPEIAKQIGCTASSVYFRMSQLGIPTARQRRKQTPPSS